MSFHKVSSCQSLGTWLIVFLKSALKDQKLDIERGNKKAKNQLFTICNNLYTQALSTGENDDRIIIHVSWI